MILAVLLGAGVMIIGVFAGFVISRSEGPRGYEGAAGVQGPKGDMGLCQCTEGEKYFTEGND